MVKEYAIKYYFPAHNASTRLEADNFAQAITLADHIDRYRRNWGRVRVNSVQCEAVRAGSVMNVTAVVELGGLAPDEVAVQIRRGLLDPHGELVQAEAIPMTHDKDLYGGAHRFRGQFATLHSPREAWIVRILPFDKLLVRSFIPGLIAAGMLNRAESHVENHG
jgi:starch phosphorylase